MEKHMKERWFINIIIAIILFYNLRVNDLSNVLAKWPGLLHPLKISSINEQNDNY